MLLVILSKQNWLIRWMHGQVTTIVDKCQIHARICLAVKIAFMRLALHKIFFPSIILKKLFSFSIKEQMKMERSAPNIWHPSRDTLTACLLNLRKTDHQNVKSADFLGRIFGTPFWISAQTIATCVISWMDLDWRLPMVSLKKLAIPFVLNILAEIVLVIESRINKYTIW